MKTASRRGGAPVGLTREAILRAADTMEVPDLSMSALAKALGVSHAALYHWFPNKQAVIQALVESTLNGVVLPPRNGRPWQADVLETARVLRNLLVARSDYLAHVSTSVSAATTPIAERLLDTLDAGGLSEQEAVQLTELVFALCFYSASQSAYLDSHELRDEDSMNDYLDTLGAAPDSRLRLLVTRHSSRTGEQIFEENLQALLDRFSRP